jgi:hypothetical protein
MQNTRHKELDCNNLQRVFKKPAERTGFEPAEGCDPFTDLANRRFRPLSHLSEVGSLVQYSTVAFERRKRRNSATPNAIN